MREVFYRSDRGVVLTYCAIQGMAQVLPANCGGDDLVRCVVGADYSDGVAYTELDGLTLKLNVNDADITVGGSGVRAGATLLRKWAAPAQSPRQGSLQCI